MIKKKILYIAGYGRSGSTLLDQLLGGLSGFFSTGQLSDIWLSGMIQNSKCSCGYTFDCCDTWKNIISKTFAGTDNINPTDILKLQKHVDKSFFLYWINSVSRLNLKTNKGLSASFFTYVNLVNNLYEAIYSVTGCNVIIDSSKTPSFLYAISNFENFNIYVIHLVRDPRAVAYSWMRNKPFMPPLTTNPTKTSIYSATQWAFTNVQVEMLCKSLPIKYLILRYEDFIRNPDEYLKYIVNFLGKAELMDEISSFHFNKELFLEERHTFSGNINRFKKQIKMQPDDEWKTKMVGLNKTIVEIITRPLMKKYQYH